LLLDVTGKVGVCAVGEVIIPVDEKMADVSNGDIYNDRI